MRKSSSFSVGFVVALWAGEMHWWIFHGTRSPNHVWQSPDWFAIPAMTLITAWLAHEFWLRFKEWRERPKYVTRGKEVIPWEGGNPFDRMKGKR